MFWEIRPILGVTVYSGRYDLFLDDLQQEPVIVCRNIVQSSGSHPIGHLCVETCA